MSQNGRWYREQRGNYKGMSITRKLWSNGTIPQGFRKKYRRKYSLAENKVGRVMAQWQEEGEKKTKSFAHIVWEYYNPGKRIRKNGRVIMKIWNDFSKESLFVCERSIENVEEEKWFDGEE